jgi:hypothetical protein
VRRTIGMDNTEADALFPFVDHSAVKRAKPDPQAR